MPHHRDSACLSTSGPRGRRRRLFRTAKLNAAGWAAVAGWCAAGAAMGLAAARRGDAPGWVAAPIGGAAAFAAVVAADRGRWARMPTAYSWTDNRAEVQRVATLLRRAGIRASAETDEFGQPTLRYLNGDHRRVTRVFRTAGLPCWPPAA